MSLAGPLARLAGACARRPRAVLALAALLVLGGAALALRLQPTAATSSFVSSSSPTYRATQRFYASFGEEPVEVIVQGNLQQVLLSDDLERLVGLEGCLSGKVPAQALPLEGGQNGPCAKLGRLRSVKVVFGPGTFLNEAVGQIEKELSTLRAQAKAEGLRAQRTVSRAARAGGKSAAEAATLGKQAREVTEAGYQSRVFSLALEYGITSVPTLSDKEFISDVVFDPAKPAGTPKQRFAYLFPSPNMSLISVRMRPGLSQQDRNRTIVLVRQAVQMPQWHLEHGSGYLVTGEPVIVSDLTKSISSSIELLLIAVLIVMAGALGLVFLGRPRLLPLVLALLASALTFGALSAVGASLTVASIAVLPVLVGLAVDYAIQFQSRVAEAEQEAGPDRLPEEDPDRAALTPARRQGAIERAARLGGPTIATAAAASAAAMLVLLLSPVPMVRGFGVLLVVGVALALLCAFSAGAAVMSVAPLQRPLRRGPLAESWRGAGELLRDNRITAAVRSFALGTAVRNPGRVLAAGLALAALGWGLDTQTHVQTDITKLVPQSLGSLQALNRLENTTGVGGEVAVLLSGRDLATPAAIEWMTRYESRMLGRFGYSSSRGCGRARLCPAFSLPDLFEQQPGSGAKPARLSAKAVDGLLATIPAYFSQDVITPDRRVATLSFGIRLMSLEEQQKLVEAMRSQLHPPAGIQAQLVGLPVLAAQSGSQVASPWRRVETLLAGLAAVALILLIAFRGDRRRAFVPLVPIVLATGWSALVLFAVRIPLNPMSVTLGALVIAISTEFSVLLSERHRQELAAGHNTVEALRRAYARTGAAVAASGVTAIAGFGVLIVSDIRMLRDFGIVTLIDLTVSLLGVLVALPAAVLMADRPLPALRRARVRRRRRIGWRARSDHGSA
jgi:hydrophobe/amphiphile efflux-3 (HAE3) family protein